MYSPHCSLDISYGTCWESLFGNQEISSLVIISFIPMTCMFDHVVGKEKLHPGLLLGVKGFSREFIRVRIFEMQNDFSVH